MELANADSLIQYVKAWGVGYSTYIVPSPHHCCPKCAKLEKIDSNRAWCQAVIGFSVEQPRRADFALGILILECPVCGTRFWSHLLPEGIWNCMAFCPRWPKRMKHPDLR